MANTLKSMSTALAIKGGNESDTTGAAATLNNAVFDALWDLGVRRVPLPLTPHAMWRTLKACEMGL